MFVNFRVREISRAAHKLVRTSTLIKKKIKSSATQVELGVNVLIRSVNFTVDNLERDML
jgi:hypothetical protein